MRFAFAVILVLMGASMISCSPPDLLVQCQVTGSETNCYLLYDPATRDAAIIDVGGPIDELLAVVRSEDLRLRYFLLTHGHIDHLMGLPAIRGSFPGTLVCIHEDGYADLQTVAEWARETLGEEVLAEWRQDPELRKIVEFDVGSFREPDMFLEDGQVLELGRHTVRVLHCPGHSRGGLCYSIDNLLFSGDVLFRGSVGRVDLQNSSRDDQIASVRRLYKELPENTAVYPGHGEPTTIGDEKAGNERVTETTVDL